ncbi:hypothetical protein EIP91_004115 [Steccherinum ochraceum]|uniref:Uncharacterized protein n=1 Tax=Steccherinum ochraceum TaxID=92696 RepID=A0A4R0RHT8_9APHY|nr:hypothetical protein EIP91_004115 [Steccherinum ochraceum]
MGAGPGRNARELADNTAMGTQCTVLTDHLHLRSLLAERLQQCKSEKYVDVILTVSGFLGTAAFSTLRIWAVWGHALGPTLVVALTSAVVPAMNLYSATQVTSLSVMDGNCFGDVKFSPAVSIRSVNSLYSRFFTVLMHRLNPPSRRLDYAARGSAIANDALVLALTWVKTADAWRETRRIKGFKMTLSELLLRDGTVYFAMLLIMNIVAFFLDTFQADFDQSNGFLSVLNALSANLLARFILDLRSVYEEHASSKVRTMSSIHFNAGNIGAPLGVEDSTWVSGPADDVAHERDLQYEEAVIPFRAGLGLGLGLDGEDVEDVPLEGAVAIDQEALSSESDGSAELGSSTDTRVEETPRNGVQAPADNV